MLGRLGRRIAIVVVFTGLAITACIAGINYVSRGAPKPPAIPTHELAVWCRQAGNHVHLRLPANAPEFRVSLEAACGADAKDAAR